MVRFLIAQTGLLSIIGAIAILIGFVLGVPASQLNTRILRYLAVILIVIGAAACIAGVVGAIIGDNFAWIRFQFVAGALFIALGSIGLLFELRRKATIKQSGLVVATGGLLVIGSLILPVIPSQLAPITPPSITPTIATSTRTPPPTRTPVVSLTPTVPLTETPTATSLPTLSPTPPRLIVPDSGVTGTPNAGETQPPIGSTTKQPDQSTRTALPQFTPTRSVVICQIVPFRNINLRAAPDPAAALIQTIPFGTALNGTAQAGDWWKVTVDGNVQGWVIRTFVNSEPSCKSLPVDLSVTPIRLSPTP